MCGIVGYIGSREAAPILLSGLQRLEYRGYDSAGLAVQNGHGLAIRKIAGRVDRLGALLAEQPLVGSMGIAHTRWATHGAPTETNAHPHTDCHQALALVHNGIIENADALRMHLEQKGHRFRTETDTETLAHLIEDTPGTRLEDRVLAALPRIEGTYGLAVVCNAEPTKMVVARKGSPLLLGIGDGEFFIASDASAFLDHTRSVVYLEDGDVAVVTPDGHRIIDRDAKIPVRPVDDIEWTLEDIELGEYPHFMLKEICLQPRTVASTLRGRLQVEAGTARLNGLNLTPDDCRRFQRIVIIGCGTSWHAGLIGRYVIERLAGIPVEVEYASEYRHRGPIGRQQDTLVIAISQSGETADTLEAIRMARAAGGRVVGVVNVVGSTIARESDGGIYLHAGPEIGVASTKAFTSQLAALVLLALHLGRQRDLSGEEGRRLARALADLPELTRRTLAIEPQVRAIAEKYASSAHFLFLGRGVNFPVALEGALKLKEISYIHAEGFPAAEMKHGPIALIDETMPVVFIAPRDHVYSKIVSNIQEVRARGGQVIIVSTEGNGDLGTLADHQLHVPCTDPLLMPLLTVLPLQLLAYHIAVLRGCDVDRPRNLAKSVTVE